MSAITIMLIILVALLAGMEGILDEFQFHQPLVACTLIGLVSGNLYSSIFISFYTLHFWQNKLQQTVHRLLQSQFGSIQ